MAPDDDTETSPTLLRRAADWGDESAWLAFAERYRPFVRRECRARRLDPESLDEVEQRVLLSVARRIRTFRYDPSGSFRGWLRRVVERHVAGYRREAARDRARAVSGEAAGLAQVAFPERPADDDTPDALCELAGRVHAEVRGRVKPTSWRVFWEADIEGRELALVAESCGLSYYAAYMARRRVRELLERAGRRQPEGGGPT